MNVRAYTDDDRDELRRLVLELHEAVRPFDAYLAPGAQIIDAYFEHLLQSCARTNGTFFVAEDRGRLVGYVCVYGLVPPEAPDEGLDHYSFLSELYVVPDHRKQGVGKALMEQAEAYARGLGAGRIELNVLAKNLEARAFYQFQGYEPRLLTLSKRLSQPEPPG